MVVVSKAADRETVQVVSHSGAVSLRGGVQDKLEKLKSGCIVMDVAFRCIS